MRTMLALGWLHWASVAGATPPEGLWIGSSTTGASVKIVVLDVAGAVVEGVVEVQTESGTFRNVPFTGQLRGTTLTGSGDGLTLSLEMDGVRMSGKIVESGRTISASFVTSGAGGP